MGFSAEERPLLPGSLWLQGAQHGIGATTWEAVSTTQVPQAGRRVAMEVTRGGQKPDPF